MTDAAALKHIFQVKKDQSRQRIDKFLVERLSPDFSRMDIKKIMQEEHVRVNGKIVKPHHLINENDLIEILINEKIKLPDTVPAVNMGLDIIFEDEYLIVVNKPAGMVVHPAAGHHDDTLVNGLLFHTKMLSDVNGPFKPGIVHRLDKDTSGVIVVAKDNKTHRFLAEQFRQHLVKKVYIAIVSGSVEYDEGIIEAPLSRSPFDRKKITVQYSSPRQAISYYRVLKRTGDFSIVEVHPKTGRTHQIRVHMAHLGHPLLGDTVYGKKNSRELIQRQALHAKLLAFKHPLSGSLVEYAADIPEDMRRIIG